jgi:hypothetical protein
MNGTATKDATQQTATKQGFRQITGNSGAALFVLNEGANHSKSMKTLEDANLRSLKYQEALSLLMKDEVLKNALKGTWFYLSGEGMDKHGLFTVNSKGELVGLEATESYEKIVRVWSGPHPLSLVVLSADDARQDGRRFDLYAGYGPDDVAPVVVGVPKDWKLEAELEPGAAEGREAAAPKIAPELLERAKSSVAKLDAAEQAGALANGITGPLKELLRTLE